MEDADAIARKNEVKFVLAPSNTDLIDGSFTILDFYITSGGNSEGKIYGGLVVKCGISGTFIFECARKGSEDTAEWFKKRVKANSNTFDEDPEDLNFALQGTLELVINWDGAEKTYRFTDVMLAQGSTFLSNNWWFGGSSAECRHTSDDTVRYWGHTLEPDNPRATIWFQRGDNDVDKVTIKQIENGAWSGYEE